MLELETLGQSRGLSAVMPLARRQAHAQRIAQPVHTDVDLGREAATRAPQRLAGLTAACRGCTGCTCVSTHQRTVDDQVLPIWLIGKLVQPLRPYALVTPPCKALIDAVPFSITVWQQAPLGTTAQHPQHPIQEPAAVDLTAHINSLTRPQERQDFYPFVVV